MNKKLFIILLSAVFVICACVIIFLNVNVNMEATKSATSDIITENDIISDTEETKYDEESSDKNSFPDNTTDCEYNVIFKDYNGSVIKEEYVKSGKAANEPNLPQREGYIFSKWDKSFDNITGNMIVTAEYLKPTKPTVCVQSTLSGVGDTVIIPIIIYNNPGISGMQLNVSYSSDLSLVKSENGNALSSLYFTAPGTYANPCKFLWDSVGENDKGNGTVLNLTFKTPDDAKSGVEYEISLAIPEGTVFDSDLNDVAFEIVNGSIKIK